MAAPRLRSLGQLIAQTQIPANTVGIFWPGGASMVFKSVQQRVYLFDPSATSWARGSQIGAIDIKPDLVFCSVDPGDELDVPTLTHLATAFPDTRFASSPKSRDAMIGRHVNDILRDVPVDPARVHTLEHTALMDVQQVGLADKVQVRVLNAGDSPWNVLLSFSGVQICLLRHVNDAAQAEAICEAIKRRVDVLLWALPGAQMPFAKGVLDGLRPGYAIPFAYDRLLDGGDLARQFRDLVARISGVKTYLFAEDYMEGLLYSRMMSRKRR